VFSNYHKLLSFLIEPFRGIIQLLWEKPIFSLSEKYPVYLIQFLEVAVLAFIVWRVFKFIKGTQAEQLLKGILVIVAALIFTKAVHLEIIGRVLESLVNVVLLGLVVIFQPELRRILGYLGQSGIFARDIFNVNTENDTTLVINSLVEAIKHLSKTHTGALIVLEGATSTDAYILEVGTMLNADVSVELILTLFHPNTPLHDGAVVINGEKIVAAGVLLPLTEDPKLSWQYGTRHRAAIGMSQKSNSFCLVVSEETGEISIARAGTLKKFVDTEELRKGLEAAYRKLYSTKKKDR
jgi:diadenylate cyclase